LLLTFTSCYSLSLRIIKKGREKDRTTKLSKDLYINRKRTCPIMLGKDKSCDC